MPRYELMYLLGSQVADPDVQPIAQRVIKHVTDFGGTKVEEQHLGKKKLAYPIKKTRNGYYVVVGFDMDSLKVNEFDARLRTQEHDIIRYLIVNLDEHLERLSKDKVAQSKLKHPVGAQDEEVKPAVEEITPVAKAPKAEKAAIKLEDIDEKTLDEKIEKALSEDLTK